MAEEIAHRLVGHVRPAFAVDHVARRLAGDELRDRRDDDRVPHLGPHPRHLLQHLIEQLGPAQLAEHPPGGGDHAAGELMAVIRGVELPGSPRRQPLGAGQLVEVRRHDRLLGKVEPVGVTGGLQVARRAQRLRLGGTTAQCAGGGVDRVKAGADALQVDLRCEPDRAVAVQLQRTAARRRQQRRGQLPDRVDGQQPAGILEVQPVHVRAISQRGGDVGVVAMGVDLADGVRQADHHLLHPLGLGHRGDPLDALRIVGGVGDLHPAQAVADHQPVGERHHLLVGGHPGDEAHAGGDHSQRRAGHRR